VKPGRMLGRLLLFFVLIPSAFAIHVFYVDGVHGSDTNDCKSRRMACKTIGHAISLSSPHDSVLVAPGVYGENLTVAIDLQIVGSSPRSTVIDGGAITSVVTIAQGARVSLAGLTLQNGEAGIENFAFGGGINNQGTAFVFDTVIRNNVAGDYIGDDAEGGGIRNQGDLTLDHSFVVQNAAAYSYFGYGAGVFNRGTMSITDSSVSENFDLSTPDLYGTGIYNSGTLVVNRSAINRNQGAFDTAGIYNDCAALAIINNTTISLNGAGYDGPALTNCGTMKINSSTIFGNLAEYSMVGGLFDYQGSITLQNTIVADNAKSNCRGTVVSGGYNLSSDASCNFDGAGDLNNTEPKLGPLRNNGGFSATLAELPGSPTIDAGNPDGCIDADGHRLKTDQRGFPRPGRFDHEHRCDIGAFERQRD